MSAKNLDKKKQLESSKILDVQIADLINTGLTTLVYKFSHYKFYVAGKIGTQMTLSGVLYITRCQKSLEKHQQFTFFLFFLLTEYR